MPFAILKPVIVLFLASVCFSISAQAPSDTLGARQLREDFAQLYAQLKASHRDLFANRSEAEFDQAYQSFLSAISEDMHLHDAHVLFQRFVAKAEIAHTRIDLPVEHFLSFWEQGGRSVPFYVRIENDRVWLSDVFVASDTLKTNQEILAINTKPVAQWLHDMSMLISADDQRLANTQIETMFPWLMWLLVGEIDTYTLRIKTPAGETTQEVKASTRAEQLAIAAQQMNQAQQDSPQREHKILANNIAYLKPGPFYNITPDAPDVWDKSAFLQFIDAAFNHFISAEAKALIIDLRDNPGGTNSFSDPIIAWFADKPFAFASDFSVKISKASIAANQARLEVSQNPESISHKLARFYKAHDEGDIASMPLEAVNPREDKQFDGPVYVLVNRYSYSNAVTMSAVIQDYEFGTIIGEPTADYATTYGAMESFTLNHSGIKVGFPKALIVRPSGNKTPMGITPDLNLPLYIEGEKQDMLQLAIDTVSQQLE